MEELVFTEYPSRNVLLITMNDPQHRNAFSAEMLSALSEAVDQAIRAPDVQVILLTGAGKTFVAGADIHHMQALSAEEAIDYARRTTAVYGKIERSPKVFIAAVNGYALGAGFELTMTCDLITASERAQFGLPETGLGIIPGGHGTQKLPKLIGLARAKEMIFLGKSISAQEAWSMGLVNRVTSEEALLPETLRLAEELAQRPASAIGYAKDALNASRTLGEESGCAYEEKLFGLCFATKAQKEGMTAFLERRKPVFSRG